MKEYEEELSTSKPSDVRRLSLPKVFALFPVPPGYYEQLKVFKKVFKPSELRTKRPANDISSMFSNLIHSEGFSLDFIFCRKKKHTSLNDDKGCSLRLEDFDIHEFKENYKSYFIDAGRKHVFTAVSGNDTNDNEVRRCSNREYDIMTGSVKYQKRLEREKNQDGLKLIESEIPTIKTTKNEQYLTYLKYILSNLQRLFHFYNKQRAEDRFRLLQGQQRAKERMVNMILNGDKKYNKKRQKNTKRNKLKRKKKDKKQKKEKRAERKKRSKAWAPVRLKEDKERMSLIVFEAGMFEKDRVRLKKNQVGITGILWRTLKKREYETKSLIVLDIDEYNTSKVCSACGFKEMKVPSKIKGFGALQYSNCGIIWNRDLNAVKNMLIISNEIWSGRERPQRYKPKSSNKSNPLA